MTGASRATIWSASADERISGGSNRTTVSWVTLISRPAAKRLLDEFAARPVEFDTGHQAHAADLLHATDPGQFARAGPSGGARPARRRSPSGLRSR